jgi:hypothetical protein
MMPFILYLVPLGSFRKFNISVTAIYIFLGFNNVIFDIVITQLSGVLEINI